MEQDASEISCNKTAAPAHDGATAHAVGRCFDDKRDMARVHASRDISIRTRNERDEYGAADADTRGGDRRRQSETPGCCQRPTSSARRCATVASVPAVMSDVWHVASSRIEPGNDRGWRAARTYADVSQKAGLTAPRIGLVAAIVAGSMLASAPVQVRAADETKRRRPLAHGAEVGRRSDGRITSGADHRLVSGCSCRHLRSVASWHR
jgi:hypothetical protein